MRRIFDALCYLFGGIGLLLLVIALLLVQRSRTFIEEAERAEGTVVRLERMSSGDTWRPVVEYVSESGLEVEFTVSYGTNPPSYTEGERVSVLYRPGEEWDARIEGFASLWFFPTLVGFFAAIFLTLGATFLFIGRRAAQGSG